MMLGSNEKPTEYEYFTNKRADKIYLSRAIENKQIINIDGITKELSRPVRIVSKVLDTQDEHTFVKDGKEVSLRISKGGRIEIKATFFEDNRNISVLTIQKYSGVSGMPHALSFSFIGEEIDILFNFIRNISLLPIRDQNKAQFEDHLLKEIILSKETLLKVMHEHPELIQDVLNSGVTHKDIVNIKHRKEQLERFEQLLHNPDYFEKERTSSRGDEGVWQKFFEENKWIFGYGLNFIFNSALEGKQLEQVVSGSTIFESGKRVDALLKSKGLISSLCFCEIKTHKTNLLKKGKEAYRGESWAISDEFSGAIAQIQRTVHKSLKGIQSKTEVKNESGDPTGEQLFLYQPKSFIVIGSLDEFITEHGINEEKYSSFELFRQNIHRPEVITFDELYERAKFIVHSEEAKESSPITPQRENQPSSYNDDLPF